MQAVSTMARQKSTTPAYYEMCADYMLSRVGMKFLNYDTVQRDHRGITPAVAWPDGYLQMPRGPWRLPEFVEVPRFLIDKKLGRAPKDLEDFDGIFFISATMKAILEEIDSAACEFRRCETILPSGEPGRETWLCAVTRAFVGAVDVQASENLKIGQGPNKRPSYAIPGGVTTKLKLLPDVIGNAHLFHLAEMPRRVFCDQTVYEACKVAKMAGIRFTNISRM